MKHICFLTAALIFVWALSSAALAENKLEKYGQAKVGQVEFDLYSPEGLVPVQLPDEAATLAVAGDYPPGMLVVALFVDPESAAEYRTLKAGQTPPPPKVKAVITISPEMAKEDLTLDDYERYRLVMVKYPPPYEIIKQGIGLFSYKIALDGSNVPGRTFKTFEVFTTVLIKGKLLDFNLGADNEQDFEAVWLPRTDAWRRAHL